jgi:hypothetical protein
MKIECHDRGAQIDILEDRIIGETLFCLDTSVDLMVMISTTTTKDKVEFKLAEKMDEEWRQ